MKVYARRNLAMPELELVKRRSKNLHLYARRALAVLLLVPISASAVDNSCESALMSSITSSKRVAKPLMSVPTSELAIQRLNQKLQKANADSDGVLVVGIKYDGANPGTRYQVFAGGALPIYSGSEAADMAAAIKGHSSNAKTVYFVMEAPSVVNEDAIDASLRIQWKQLSTDTELRSINSFRPPDILPLAGVTGEDRFPDLFFSKEARITRVTEPELVTSGEKKGWFRIFMEFTVGKGSTLRKAVITFFGKTKEIAQECARLLQAHKSDNSISQPESVAAIVASMTLAIRKKHPDWTEAQLSYHYHDQFGRNYIVILTPSESPHLG
jgi:hypothetical protein